MGKKPLLGWIGTFGFSVALAGAGCECCSNGPKRSFNPTPTISRNTVPPAQPGATGLAATGTGGMTATPMNTVGSGQMGGMTPASGMTPGTGMTPASGMTPAAGVSGFEPQPRGMGLQSPGAMSDPNGSRLGAPMTDPGARMTTPRDTSNRFNNVEQLPVSSSGPTASPGMTGTPAPSTGSMGSPVTAPEMPARRGMDDATSAIPPAPPRTDLGRGLPSGDEIHVTGSSGSQLPPPPSPSQGGVGLRPLTPPAPVAPAPLPTPPGAPEMPSNP